MQRGNRFTVVLYEPNFPTAGIRRFGGKTTELEGNRRLGAYRFDNFKYVREHLLSRHFIPQRYPTLLQEMPKQEKEKSIKLILVKSK